MNLKRSIAVLACVVLSALALANPAPEPDLKKIMQGLLDDTVSILDALLIIALATLPTISTCSTAAWPVMRPTKNAFQRF
ncbi:MAG: hypothetical protein OEM45_08550 [Gammaproteobacteria bacterium]|nr:hypothetical protein [Gammaproteobacteria bacterium]MDH3491123.1 hypothetical protein [Gammaproteobacteria bacterium]MDH3578742.1 hypothetical protein [Gammaproteobacteria bacterium]